MKWVVIVIILLIVFGSKKIPDLGKGLGEGIKSFKDVFKGDRRHVFQAEIRGRNPDQGLSFQHRSAPASNQKPRGAGCGASHFHSQIRPMKEGL